MIRLVKPDPAGKLPKIVYYSFLGENLNCIVGAVFGSLHRVFLKCPKEWRSLDTGCLRHDSESYWTMNANSLEELCEKHRREDWHIVACDTLAELLAIKPEDLK